MKLFAINKERKNNDTFLRSSASDEEEKHGEQDEGEVDELGAEILLVEDHGTEEETDDDGATPHHGDDADHGTVEAEGVEVG